jgi:hypothetical protein
VPFALSVTGPIVPSLVPAPLVNVTVRPPLVCALPAASLTLTVSVAVPPTVNVVAELSTVLCVADAGPGETVTEGIELVTAAPFSVAANCLGEPAVVPVNVAVYVPLLLSVTPLSVPSLTPEPPVPRLIATVAPPDVMFAPPPSLACSVTVTALPDATDVADTDTVDVAADGTAAVVVSGPGSVPPPHDARAVTTTMTPTSDAKTVRRRTAITSGGGGLANV